MSRTILLDTATRKDMAIKAIHDAPEDHEAVIRKRKIKRNLEQNSCSWAIYTEVGKYMGETPRAVHDIALEAYGGKRTVALKGVEFDILNMHTSDFSMEEMSLFLDWLQAWAIDNAEVDARTIRRNYRV